MHTFIAMLKFIKADVFRKSYLKHSCAPTHQHRKFHTFYSHRETCEVNQYLTGRSSSYIVEKMWLDPASPFIAIQAKSVGIKKKNI